MLQDLFRAATVNDPSKVAVVDGVGRLTYAELQAAAEAFAARLLLLGAQPGDRVAIALPNGTDAAITLLGTLAAGAVIVPVHAALKGEALQAVIADADPRWLLTRPGEIVERPATDSAASADLAAIVYTSGSSGEPKGVMLTHASMISAIEMVNAYLGIGPSDVIHTALPLSSSYGLYQLLLGLTVGATVALDRGFAFPASCLAFAARERATVMAAVPTMLGWMAQTPLLEKHDLRALRLLTSAAAAMPAAQALRLRERLPHARLFVMYGQTECKRISYLEPDDLPLHAGSVGRGMAGQEHAVVDAQGHPAAIGEVGELLVRGPHVMRGYWRRPDLTAEKLRAAADGRLWMHTGDAFSRDEAGYLYFMGRQDEVMKIGGHKVSPAEIEGVLCQMPEVLEAAVVGVPDAQWGQVAAAYLVMTPDNTLSVEDVRRFCSQRLRGYMVPRRVAFRSSLPKTASGKILKRAIETVPGDRT